MNHTEFNKLMLDYVDGALSGDDLERFEAHVTANAEAAAQLEAYRAVISTLGRAPVLEPSHNFLRGVFTKLEQVEPWHRKLLRWIVTPLQGGAPLEAYALAALAAFAFAFFISQQPSGKSDIIQLPPAEARFDTPKQKPAKIALNESIIIERKAEKAASDDVATTSEASGETAETAAGPTAGGGMPLDALRAQSAEGLAGIGSGAMGARARSASGGGLAVSIPDEDRGGDSDLLERAAQMIAMANLRSARAEISEPAPRRAPEPAPAPAPVARATRPAASPAPAATRSLAPSTEAPADGADMAGAPAMGMAMADADEEVAAEADEPAPASPVAAPPAAPAPGGMLAAAGGEAPAESARMRVSSGARDNMASVLNDPTTLDRRLAEEANRSLPLNYLTVQPGQTVGQAGGSALARLAAHLAANPGVSIDISVKAFYDTGRADPAAVFVSTYAPEVNDWLVSHGARRGQVTLNLPRGSVNTTPGRLIGYGVFFQAR